MTAPTYFCRNSEGRPKESFASEHAARAAIAQKRRFQKRRFPRVYRCPVGHFHYTSGDR